MEELNNHIIYKILENRYPELVLDFVILSTKTYVGVETHKNAIIKAFEIIEKKNNMDFIINEEKMKFTQITIDDLLKLPDDNYYDNKPKVASRAYDIPSTTPYWYAFLEPPYANPYLTKDFIEFNEILFPNRQNIIVYRWNDDFSNYFDMGKEWWGTGLWSIYDKATGVIVIIGASATD